MKPQPPKALSTAQYRYLASSLFVTGAVTLVLEIVGTRVISPYYGSSLYCWSALITVTLVSLAAGYSLGGRYADRSPTLTQFSRLTCFAGAACAFVPLLRSPVLKTTAGLGIQLGALTSATILIAPTLILLSTLGPLAIRLTTLGLESMGRRVGDVYTVSTLGSVTGAVLAGFVLIPHFAISHILFGLSVLLLLIGAVGLWLSAQRLPLAPLVAATAIGCWGFWPRVVPRTNLLVNTESAYGQIKVIDYDTDPKDVKRYLLVNGTSQSVARADGESDSQYMHGVEWAALLRPQTRRALVIGLGAGLLPAALERVYGLTTDAVDIDPEILRMAKEYFAYRPRGEAVVEDGRTYLERAAPGRYGLIFLDAFGTESPPYHLFTREAFETFRSRLEPGGILSVNLVSIVNAKGDGAYLAAYKTLSSVFPQVRAFIASDTFEDIGNVLFFCSDVPLDGAVALGKVREIVRKDITGMLARELHPTEEQLRGALLLTDDHAPIEFLLAETAGRWRVNLQKQVSELLLY